MQKKILFFVALAVFAVMSIQTTFAGVLELVAPDTLVKGNNSVEEYKAYPHLKNTSISATNVKATFTIVSLAEGHEYQVCTTMSCYPPKTVNWTSPAFPIAGSTTTTNNDFYIGLMTNAIEGISKFVVKIENATDATDFVEYNLTFEIGILGINEYITKNSMVFPNPAANSVSLKLDNKTTSNSELKVYSASGAEVISQHVNSDTDLITLDLNSLTNGTYYFTVNSNGSNLSSGRFTVNK